MYTYNTDSFLALPTSRRYRIIETFCYCCHRRFGHFVGTLGTCIVYMYIVLLVSCIIFIAYDDFILQNKLRENLTRVSVYTVWVKKGFLTFSPNDWEFLVQILQAYYTFHISGRLQIFLFNYLQLWWSYAILSATTQFTSYVQNVHHRPKRTLAYSAIFPKWLGIFSLNFAHLLHVSIYARLQTLI